MNLTNKVIEFSSCMMQRPGYGVIMGVYFSIRFVLVIVHYLYSDIIYIRRTDMVCIKYTWVDILCTVVICVSLHNTPQPWTYIAPLLPASH